ncbi:MAG: hypothetical protein HKP41_17185 [Desulfobacterales bacterium]|nr:hypothetical protein [Deltaproteobacteria bacterium]MBT8362493.1 hypothetical protein [Deltaproteobacteria bacterium]NNK96087.1 hypothetical protein [Desulfobacterales bacterium]
MKRILAAVVIIMACASNSGAEETFKTVSLSSYLESRDNGGASFELIKSFVNGVADGYSWANIDTEGTWGKQFFCPPEHLAVSRDDYLDILDEYIKRNKGWLADDTPIQPIMIKSLIDEFPCKR